jgi:3-deoxy-manno-octulosonate cytidylyltransferase (CMP-KDO synthetase)
MKVVGIIPCRYQSSRFPGKPLALIGDKPMMWHTYQRALESNVLDQVYIATDDDQIAEEANNFSLNVIMTSSEHKTGTDRVAEVSKYVTSDYYINIQGDEPFIDPNSIQLLVEKIINCKDPAIQAVNAYTLIEDINEVVDINTVKVIMDVDNNALAYSRQAIPYPKSDVAMYYKQLGLYAFKLSGLKVFIDNPPASLELIEGVEMYRLLENQHRIAMVQTNDSSLSVDTPIDLKRVQKIFCNE